MDDRSETIHVTFGRSIAESVGEALRLRGDGARVVGLPDNLSYGPIDPPEAGSRRAWIAAVLRHGPHSDTYDDAADPERSWAEAAAPGRHPVFWVCRTSAAEQACFLAFVARMDGRPFDVVDATGLDLPTVPGIRSPWSLGLLRPQQIVDAGLAERRRPISAAEVEEAREAWSRLRQENAPLRIVRDGRLVSAPLTHFDDDLIARASPDWEIAIRLIGRTVTGLCHDAEPQGRSPSDIVLFGRLIALGEAGALDLRGPGPNMRDYEVRRAG